MAGVYKVTIFVRDWFPNLTKIKSLCTFPLFNIEIPETFRFEEETTWRTRLENRHPGKLDCMFFCISLALLDLTFDNL